LVKYDDKKIFDSSPLVTKILDATPEVKDLKSTKSKPILEKFTKNCLDGIWLLLLSGNLAEVQNVLATTFKPPTSPTVPKGEEL